MHVWQIALLVVIFSVLSFGLGLHLGRQAQGSRAATNEKGGEVGENNDSDKKFEDFYTARNPYF